MAKTTYRGVVRGGMVLLDKETPLTEGTEVLVMPLSGAPGSPAAILAAMDNSPKVPSEWVHELERLIAESVRCQGLILRWREGARALARIESANSGYSCQKPPSVSEFIVCASPAASFFQPQYPCALS